MYEKSLEKIEEAGKIRNIKEHSMDCCKNYDAVGFDGVPCSSVRMETAP